MFQSWLCLGGQVISGVHGLSGLLPWVVTSGSCQELSLRECGRQPGPGGAAEDLSSFQASASTNTSAPSSSSGEFSCPGGQDLRSTKQL